MRSTTVLIVEVVSVLPYVEGEEGLEAVCDGVIRIGVLADGQLAFGIGLQPYPTGAKEPDSLGLELGLEGIEGVPLLLNLSNDLACRSRWGGGELCEVQVVVQNLTSIVEDSTR